MIIGHRLIWLNCVVAVLLEQKCSGQQNNVAHTRLKTFFQSICTANFRNKPKISFAEKVGPFGVAEFT